MPPFVVNEAVAVCVKPGESVAVAKASVVSTPAVIASVAAAVGPSVRMSLESRVDTAAVSASMVADGVTVFAMVNVTVAPAAIVPPPSVVTTSVREPAVVSHAAVPVAVPGAVNTIAGALSKAQPLWRPAAAGITMLTLPPCGTWPDATKDAVEICLNCGESVAVAKDRVVSAPTVIAARTPVSPPSATLSPPSYVVIATVLGPVIPDGVRVSAMVKVTVPPAAISAVAVVMVSARLAASQAPLPPAAVTLPAGAVKPIAGVVVTNPQPAVTVATVGRTIWILPPMAILPAVVKLAVETAATPGTLSAGCNAKVGTRLAEVTAATVAVAAASFTAPEASKVAIDTVPEVWMPDGATTVAIVKVKVPPAGTRTPLVTVNLRLTVSQALVADPPPGAETAMTRPPPAPISHLAVEPTFGKVISTISLAGIALVTTKETVVVCAVDGVNAAAAVNVRVLSAPAEIAGVAVVVAVSLTAPPASVVPISTVSATTTPLGLTQPAIVNVTACPAARVPPPVVVIVRILFAVTHAPVAVIPAGLVMTMAGAMLSNSKFVVVARAGNVSVKRPPCSIGVARVTEAVATELTPGLVLPAMPNERVPGVPATMALTVKSIAVSRSAAAALLVLTTASAAAACAPDGVVTGKATVMALAAASAAPPRVTTRVLVPPVQAPTPPSTVVAPWPDKVTAGAATASQHVVEVQAGSTISIDPPSSISRAVSKETVMVVAVNAEVAVETMVLSPTSACASAPGARAARQSRAILRMFLVMVMVIRCCS